jgi:hypothetical protein
LRGSSIWPKASNRQAIGVVIRDRASKGAGLKG